MAVGTFAPVSTVSSHTLNSPRPNASLPLQPVLEERGGFNCAASPCEASSCAGVPASSFLLAAFRRRHCCSWRWRGEGEQAQGEWPEQHRCPELFGCEASGRGRWPTAVRPRGPPYDKPGNVGWRPTAGGVECVIGKYCHSVCVCCFTQWLRKIKEDEYLCIRCDYRFWGELHLGCF